MVKINSDSCYEEYTEQQSKKPQDWNTMKDRGFCVIGETKESYKVYLNIRVAPTKYFGK